MSMFDFMAEGIDVGTQAGPEVKTLCPQCSHTRKKATQRCLNVNLDSGVWNCWHCGWSGKAKDPRTQQRDHQQRTTSDRPKAYVKPNITPGKIADGALKWLANRGITEPVLLRNRVHTASVYMPQVQAEVLAVAFPYYRDGQVINAKYRDTAKNFCMISGAERILYGYDDISTTTIVVEGEMDKLAVEVAGMQNCVSVPDGAPAANAKNFGQKFDFLNDEHLQKVETWVVAVDNDAPGQRLQDELVRRFGPEKCKLATWPDGCKDANDVLMHHGPQTLRECIEMARPVPIVGVFNADDFADDFLRMYEEGAPNGITTGWDSVDKNWRVQPGQLLVVTGIPGQGKSEWVDALCVNLALDHGWRTAFYSPENAPTALHIMKLAEKFIRKPFNAGPVERMSREEATKAKDWISSHFDWILPEQPSLEEIVDRARALVLRRGIRVLVVDPWNEVEHSRPVGMSEVEYIGRSLSMLRRFAREKELLVIVVAHPRLMDKKSDGGYVVPTPYDISGGAMWRNKADNCITVFADPADTKGAVEIHVQKVKFKLFGKVGMVPMFWDRTTGLYYDRIL